MNPLTSSPSDVASLLVDGSYYKTESVLLQSPSLAKRVIESLKLYDDSRFTQPPKPSGSYGQIEVLVRDGWNRLRSRLISVLSPKELKTNETTQNEESRAQELVDAYLTGLTISPIEESRLVTINYSSTSPELAATIANTHAAEFIKMAVESRLDMNEEAQKILEERLAQLRKQTEESDARLNEFRRQHRVLAVGGNEKENVALDRLGSLNTDYAKAQSERIAAEAQYNLVRNRQYDQLASVQRDPLYNNLRDQLEQLKSEYGRLAQIYKPAYPKMTELAGQIDVLEKRIAEQVHGGVAGVESQYLAAKAKEDALAEEIENERRAVLDVGDLSVKYQVLAREADADRQLYTNLITRAKEASIAHTVEANNIRVVDPARIPKDPSFLGFRQGFSRAVVLGVLLGLCLAFGLEYLDSTIKTPEDAEEFLQLPSLAVVPSFSYEGPRRPSSSTVRSWLVPRFLQRWPAEERRKPILLRQLENPIEGPAARSIRTPNGASGSSPSAVPSELMVVQRPSSAIAEAYKTLRTAVLLSSADNPPKIIQMISASSREGKTVTCVNTALTLAQSGARVLLIDADLRRPRCHGIFRVPRAPGLVDHLVGHVDLQKCIRPLELGDVVSRIHAVPKTQNGNSNGNGDSPKLLIGSVDVIAAGTRAPNPAEILGSMRMRETLQLVRDLYDFVIVDSPPVLPVADSIVLGTMVDAVVLVIRGQVTPKNVVRQAAARLDRMKVRVIGTVLNAVDVTSGDYYYYKGYYASYGYLDDQGGAA
jgi:uncharacterized protein involved in exopolysaccharide biosynthesis/Mrp family chromosome partitioning ATPase